MNRSNASRITYALLVLTALLIPLTVMGYKLYVLDYPVAGMIPAVSYKVDVSMQVDGHGGDIELSTYLPKTDMRQTVMDEENASGLFTLSLQSDFHNRLAVWQAESVQGRQTIRYSYSVQAKHVRYEIPEHLTIPAEYPASFQNGRRSAWRVLSGAVSPVCVRLPCLG